MSLRADLVTQRAHELVGDALQIESELVTETLRGDILNGDEPVEPIPGTLEPGAYGFGHLQFPAGINADVGVKTLVNQGTSQEWLVGKGVAQENEGNE
jgi:hypothetical protein